MSDYKINIDKPNPTKEETSKFKNFDTIAKDFETVHKPMEFHKKLFKDKKLIRFFILLLAVLLALFFGRKEEKEETKPQEEQENYFETPTGDPTNSSD